MQVLNGIKVVKLYAWEEPMEKHINAIRVRWEAQFITVLLANNM